MILGFILKNSQILIILIQTRKERKFLQPRQPTLTLIFTSILSPFHQAIEIIFHASNSIDRRNTARYFRNQL